MTDDTVPVAVLTSPPVRLEANALMKSFASL